MAPGALDRIRAASIGRIVTTDSVPAKPDPRIQVVSVAPLLAGALDASRRARRPREDQR